MENSSDRIAPSSSNIFQDDPLCEEKGIQAMTDSECDSSDFDSECDSSDFDSAEEESGEDSSSSENEKMENVKFEELMLARTILLVEMAPKLFLGIPKESFFIAKLLAHKAKLPISHIYIVLKKIRQHLPFEIMAVDFGLKDGSIRQIFDKSLPVLASLMQEYIVWPDRNDIQMHLPIPFRATYGNVISIIEYLEVGITNSSYEALNRHQNNTVKYLISYTPNGLVSFISKGFRGQTSDVNIVEKSGYLDKLVPGDSVVADKGFKHISNLLQQKNCSLVGLPPISAEAESIEQEVEQSNRVAAVRIHMERISRRLREFKMLQTYTCIDRNRIHIFDFVVVVACGIINMQDQLIKLC